MSPPKAPPSKDAFPDSEFESAWTAADWGQRAKRLFNESENTSNHVTSKLLRRQATAAQNIADALELAV